MSGFADYEAYDALGLAGLVRQGKVTPVELLDAAIARVEARNAKVNAVTMPLYDYARKAIAEGLPDGPFRGVPFLMKDLTASIAGVRMTRSSRFFADAPPPAADSEHVVRLKRAGLVIFGRTNTCELGLSLTCEPQLYGATRNPWDLTRISGGSSGGAAAAVGARMLPMAHATDGFGSIRAPAACCGLVGLKPTRGRNTMAPYAGEGLAGCSAEHAVTLSVRDSAALLDATAGPGAGDPYGVAAPARPFLQEVGTRTGSAAHRVDRQDAERRPRGRRAPARAERDGPALRRARSPGRGGRPGRRRRRDRADVHHAGRRQHRREPGEPSDRRPDGAAGRGREGHVRDRPEGRAHHRRGLRARHADRPPARPTDGRVPRQLGHPAHPRARDRPAEARLDRHDAGRRR